MITTAVMITTTVMEVEAVMMVTAVMMMAAVVAREMAAEEMVAGDDYSDTLMASAATMILGTVRNG